jgi:predicted phage replisome organizer
MPNGKDYILFYLKLLLESVDHEGSLRFSDTIPYNESMLSVVTNTNVDIVRSAMKIFIELGMISILDDKTIYMDEVDKMIGSAADNDNANRVRRFRERQKEQMLSDRYESVTNCNESKSKNKSKSKSKSISPPIVPPLGETVCDEKPKKSKVFVKPTVEEIRAYCTERKNSVDAETFFDFYESKGWLIGKNPMKDWQAAVRTWERDRSRGSGNPPRRDEPFNIFAEIQEQERRKGQ